MPKADLAVRMHICAETLRVRLIDPGTFTLKELRRMFEALGIPVDEQAGMIF